MSALLVRLGLAGAGGVASLAIKAWAWLAMAAAALAFLAWLAAKIYLAGVYSERIKTYEEKLADIQAKLEANDEIRRHSDADAARAEAEAERLKELLETMSNDKSCPLSKSHVDGIGKIDHAK
jgi:Flp pilus assembly protein TadB